MKCVIIEDYSVKRTHLIQCVRQIEPGIRIMEARSVNSGVRQVLEHAPDVVLLDMSLPTFDVVFGDEGGRHQSLGGREVLGHLSRRKIAVSVIVVTQFVDFGEGEDFRTLEQLDAELCKAFPNLYRGAVPYHEGIADWQDMLRDLWKALVPRLPSEDAPGTAAC